MFLLRGGLKFLGYISEDEVIEFARKLENLFHGESSGVDVAVAHMGVPIKYIRGKGIQVIDLKWKPKLTLSFSGHKGVTAECVKQVQEYIRREPASGERLDQEMRSAVSSIETALLSEGLSESERQQKFREGLQTARNVFEGWDLTKGSLSEHMNELKRLGALAVKPTGSGLGGHVLSLWDELPQNLRINFMLP